MHAIYYAERLRAIPRRQAGASRVSMLIFEPGLCASGHGRISVLISAQRGGACGTPLDLGPIVERGCDFGYDAGAPIAIKIVSNPCRSYQDSFRDLDQDDQVIAKDAQDGLGPAIRDISGPRCR